MFVILVANDEFNELQEKYNLDSRSPKKVRIPSKSLLHRIGILNWDSLPVFTGNFLSFSVGILDLSMVSGKLEYSWA